MSQAYDQLGLNYRNLRQPDYRIALNVMKALGKVRSVINVGAGTGSYEPPNKRVLAVEPSWTMICQRRPRAAPAVRAGSSALPCASGSFDAALSILSIHHWRDRERGLAELRRVARQRIVILSWDPAAPGFWLSDYLPEILNIDRRIFPTMGELESHLGPLRVSPVLIPHDCSDGFLGAYWARPQAYLDPLIRSGMSTFARLEDPASGLARLREDLKSGVWQTRHANLSDVSELDLGYRLIVVDQS